MAGGVKLSAKELRDFFATQVSAQVSDPTTVKNLMRHTSLSTTSLYTRTVLARMTKAVQNLGKSDFGGNLSVISGGDPWGQLKQNSSRETTQNDILQKLLLKLVEKKSNRLNARRVKKKHQDISQKSGGRSRNRTYDLAHVRRAL
jgi:hypothetical protein